MACCRNTNADSSTDRNTATGAIPHCSADTGSYRRTCAYADTDADTHANSDHNANTTAGANTDPYTYTYTYTHANTYSNPYSYAPARRTILL